MTIREKQEVYKARKNNEGIREDDAGYVLSPDDKDVHCCKCNRRFAPETAPVRCPRCGGDVMIWN